MERAADLEEPPGDGYCMMTMDIAVECEVEGKGYEGAQQHTSEEF